MARNAANARERSRMRILSRVSSSKGRTLSVRLREQAFSRLKTALPWVPPDTKLSKLDTLRLASSYIAHLRHLLTSAQDEDHEHEVSHGQSHCSNMVSMEIFYFLALEQQIRGLADGIIGFNWRRG